MILVSDLDDDPGDIKSLAGVALAYRHANIPVHIVALNPQPNDQQLFSRLLAQVATVQHAPLPGEQTSRTGAAVPVSARSPRGGRCALLALAANELWAARLTWGLA